MNDINKFFSFEQERKIRDFFEFKKTEFGDTEKIMHEFNLFLATENKVEPKEVMNSEKKSFATLEMAKGDNPEISIGLSRFGMIVILEFNLFVNSFTSRWAKTNMNNLEYEKVKQWVDDKSEDELSKIRSMGPKTIQAAKFLFEKY